MPTSHSNRMHVFRSAGLYLVTSEWMSAGRTTLDIIDSALKGGVRLIQLREKEMPVGDLLELARRARSLTQAHGALLLINDRIDIALAVDADGVHLGQADFPVADARRLAPDMIIGSSSHNLQEAREAEQAGASYVNIGPIFPTGTKEWTDDFLGIEAIANIAPTLSIPFTVMGGIKPDHIPDLRAAGAETIAVVTAVTAAPDPESAARDLLDLIRRA